MTQNSPIRVDSIEEEWAYLAAYPPEGGGDWRVESQQMGMRDGVAIDQVTVRSPDERERAFIFDIGSFFGRQDISPEARGSIGYLDGLMRRAAEFARENGPHHPGSLPRFPVPSDRYPGRLDVALAVLAVDGGRRGIYAPPRVVTMDRQTGEPFGVGEFPGFDPDDWPPPRLGDWPPVETENLAQAQLQGLIGRFSAVASRLYGAWLEQIEYPEIEDEKRAYVDLLRKLDLAKMEPYYRKLAGGFFQWVRAATGPQGSMRH